MQNVVCKAIFALHSVINYYLLCCLLSFSNTFSMLQINNYLIFSEELVTALGMQGSYFLRMKSYDTLCHHQRDHGLD